MPWQTWSPAVITADEQEAYWDSQLIVSGTDRQSMPAANFGCSQQNFVFTRTVASGQREDVAIFSLHWAVNAGPGALALPLSASQQGSIESITDTMWGTIKSKVSIEWVLARYDWRDWKGDNPKDKNGVTKHGAVSRTTTKNVAGTGASLRLPDQVALTVTWETASRKHWGRVYVGGLITGDVDQYGHPLSAVCDSLAGGFRTAMNSAAALPAITNLVVLSPYRQGLFTVRLVQCDNVYDVIRSRRAKATTYRKQYTS